MTPPRIAAMAALMLAGPAFADGHASGDPAEGENVFKKCRSCHAIIDNDGETIAKGGKTGPNLYGVFNRQAGTQEDFGKKYGKDLVATGEAGLMWNEADFVPYVADPRGFLREYLDNGKARSKMTFRLKDAEDAANVWAYLVSVGPAAE